MRIERVEADGEKGVVARFRLWHPVCIFLALWLTGWSLGCYKLAVNLEKMVACFNRRGLACGVRHSCCGCCGYVQLAS